MRREDGWTGDSVPKMASEPAIASLVYSLDNGFVLVDNEFKLLHHESQIKRLGRTELAHAPVSSFPLSVLTRGLCIKETPRPSACEAP